MAPRTPTRPDQAFVTLLTNDAYAVGALVLAHSLLRVHTTRSLVVLITSDVSRERREQLASIFNLVQEVPRLDSEDAANLRLLNRPELGVTFTKIHAWTLTQFNKCVFLDADTLVVQNVDDLFERPQFSAAPDVGWPDCFNSGVFVFEPAMETYRALLEHARRLGSFDGGDQGLLNLFWNDWARADSSHRLPFVYNLTISTSYGYAPALKQFGSEVRIVHFIGPIKPWHHSYSTASDQVILCPGTAGAQEPLRKFLNIWWNIYITKLPSPYLLVTPPTPPTSPSYYSDPAPSSIAPPTYPISEVSVRLAFYPPPEPSPLPPSPPLESNPLPSPPPPSSGPHHNAGEPVSSPRIEDAGQPDIDPSSSVQVLGDFSSDDREIEEEEIEVVFDSQAESDAWRASWEQGRIDYTGRDSFDRIQQHIESLINRTEEPPTEVEEGEEDEKEEITEAGDLILGERVVETVETVVETTVETAADEDD